MKKQQTGFTLIELVMVIVILGILSAVAVPKFMDISGDASTSSLDGVAGAMGSSMAINYATCSASDHDTTGDCTAIVNCNEVDSLMQGGIPTDYSVGDVSGTGNGTELTCTVTQDDTSNTKNFVGIVAGQ